MRKAIVICNTVLACLASVLPASSALASTASATSAPPSTVVINVVTVNGSGCPAGTASVALSPDNTAFTVTYSAYTALVGVGAAALDFRKNCQLILHVHVPQGFTFAIAEADYRGFASLQPGASALERANYYFQGQPQTVYAQHTIPGGTENDWEKVDQVGIASLEFAPCGAVRYLNINTELRVNGGTSNTATTTSLITMDSSDVGISTIYHFAWRTCHQ